MFWNLGIHFLFQKNYKAIEFILSAIFHFIWKSFLHLPLNLFPFENGTYHLSLQSLTVGKKQ